MRRHDDLAPRVPLETKACIRALAAEGVRPRNILASLKRADPDSAITIKDVYNQCQRLRTQLRQREGAAEGEPLQGGGSGASGGRGD